MLKAWLFGVGILFVLAEFSIWLKQFMLPLPIYILGGALLAIASNYESGLIGLFRQQGLSTEMTTQTATLVDKTEALETKSIEVNRLTEMPLSHND